MNEILTGESRKGKKTKAGRYTAHIPWEVFAVKVNTENRLAKWYSVFTDVTAEDASEKRSAATF